MGMLFEITVFVFIVQSTTILDVFLNFAALEFITSVDEFMFKLAKRGYVSNSIKKACDEVISETKVLRRKGGRICRRFQIVFFITIMMAVFAVQADWQNTGRYECKKVEVQFGDGLLDRTDCPDLNANQAYECLGPDNVIRWTKNDNNSPVV